MAKRGGFPGGGMPGNMSNLMKQAQRMQRQMEESAKELESKEFTAAAGGGAVEVTVTGKKEVTKVKLDPEAVDPDDVEMLEDLIMAATNDGILQQSDWPVSGAAVISAGNRRQDSPAAGFSYYRYASGAGGKTGGYHGKSEKNHPLLQRMPDADRSGIMSHLRQSQP